jgi:hypothetical protein
LENGRSTTAALSARLQFADARTLLKSVQLAQCHSIALKKRPYNLHSDPDSPILGIGSARLAGGALAEISGAEVRVMSYIVTVGYDEAAHRYYVISSDIPGLNVETDTFEEFVEVVQDVVPDLVGDRVSGAKIKFEREIALA